MKRMRMIFAVLVSLFFVGGCRSNTLGEESLHGNQVNQLNGVSITLNAESYQPEENHMELTVINHSDEEITYGVPYQLEYLDDGTWYVVEPQEELAFITIAYILKPGEEAKEEISLEYYEPLDEGVYRVARMIQNEPLTAEFEVSTE